MASFVIAILVARILGVEAKGQLALLQQFPAIAALLLGLGFESAHAYYVGRRGRDPGAAVSDSLALTLLASVVGLPLTALVMREFVPALAAVPASTVLLASASLPLLMLTALLGGVLPPVNYSFPPCAGLIAFGPLAGDWQSSQIVYTALDIARFQQEVALVWRTPCSAHLRTASRTHRIASRAWMESARSGCQDMEEI